MAGHRPLQPHQSRDWNVRFLRVKAPAWVTNAGRSRFTRSCCILGIKGPAQAPSNQEAVSEPCAARVGVHALSAAAPPTDDVLQRVSSLRQGSLHLTTGEMAQDLEIREFLLPHTQFAKFLPPPWRPDSATRPRPHMLLSTPDVGAAAGLCSRGCAARRAVHRPRGCVGRRRAAICQGVSDSGACHAFFKYKNNQIF